MVLSSISAWDFIDRDHILRVWVTLFHIYHRSIFDHLDTSVMTSPIVARRHPILKESLYIPSSVFDVMMDLNLMFDIRSLVFYEEDLVSTKSNCCGSS